MGFYSSLTGRTRKLNRRNTVRRQRAARSRMVTMSRAGYGATKYRRILSSQFRRGGETKSVDVTRNTYTLNSTGLVSVLNLTEEGSSFYNRLGRRIRLVSIHMTGNINPTAVNTSVQDYARVIVVYDRQTNGATPSPGVILGDYDQAGNLSYTSFAGSNPDEKDRFMILADERLVLPPNLTNIASGDYAPPDTSKNVFTINRFIKLRNLVTHYSANSSPGVVGDISTGGLFLLTTGAFASPGYIANVHFRIRFADY